MNTQTQTASNPTGTSASSQAKWAGIREVPNGGCKCDCCATTKTVAWHNDGTRIFSDFFKMTKCNNQDAGTTTAAYVLEIKGKSSSTLNFEIATNGNYSNRPYNGFKVLCTLFANNEISCDLSGNCQDDFLNSKSKSPNNAEKKSDGNQCKIICKAANYYLFHWHI